MKLKVGIDIGSTTVKVVVLDEENKTLYQVYRRHMSQVRQAALEALRGAKEILGENEFYIAISGSAGLGVAECAGIDFVQEVFATYECVKKYQPDTDAVVELGGEDAKIIFLTGGLEERMNGHSAGFDHRGNGPAQPQPYQAVPHCLPLRGVCKNGYSAFAEPGGQ